MHVAMHNGAAVVLDYPTDEAALQAVASWGRSSGCTVRTDYRDREQPDNAAPVWKAMVRWPAFSGANVQVLLAPLNKEARARGLPLLSDEQLTVILRAASKERLS